MLMVASCESDLPRFANYSAYDFTKLDEGGGNWTPVLLASPNQITITAPEAVTSPAYQAELADLKSTMSNLNDGQRGAVDYWTNNPIIRWNEIALELAAKYNLIPGPNPDNTYTLPNPATPEGPTPFPFAHPAYTSRMLAYLSVAQFDALIAHGTIISINRLAPHQNENSIEPAYGETRSFLPF